MASIVLPIDVSPSGPSLGTLQICQVPNVFVLRGRVGSSHVMSSSNLCSRRNTSQIGIVHSIKILYSDAMVPHQSSTAPIWVKLRDVPNNANVDFETSAYFRRWKQLPAPSEVRARALDQYQSGTVTDPRRTFEPDEENWEPPPVLFQEKDLWVKWGRSVRIAEGQSLYLVQNLLPQKFPSPQIYGWRTDGEETFLYCEWMRGQTLEQVWDGLDTENRLSVSQELRDAFAYLRRLQQDPEEQFLGTPSRAPLFDRCFGGFSSSAGPFKSVKCFHDWFARIYRTRIPGAEELPIEPYRWQLPDDASIHFTHSDLHPSNILVTTSKPYKLMGIVDFEQSGWLPSYWEDRKARWTVSAHEDWAKTYLPIILPPAPQTEEAWYWYVSSMGGF